MLSWRIVHFPRIRIRTKTQAQTLRQVARAGYSGNLADALKAVLPGRGAVVREPRNTARRRFDAITHPVVERIQQRTHGWAIVLHIDRVAREEAIHGPIGKGER